MTPPKTPNSSSELTLTPEPEPLAGYGRRKGLPALLYEPYRHLGPVTGLARFRRLRENPVGVVAAWTPPASQAATATAAQRDAPLTTRIYIAWGMPQTIFPQDF